MHINFADICNNVSMKNVIKCIESVMLLNVESVKRNGNSMILLSTVLHKTVDNKID